MRPGNKSVEVEDGVSSPDFQVFGLAAWGAQLRTGGRHGKVQVPSSAPGMDGIGPPISGCRESKKETNQKLMQNALFFGS